MEPAHYDLIVIGGGPGGSTAAAAARLRGLSVCVVEREAFPRFHIGESLLPAGNAVLRKTGAWAKVAAAGFVPKFGAEFLLADGSAERSVVFAQSLIPGLDSTFQVERARFDILLLEHARSLGANVRQPATVSHVLEKGSYVEVGVTEGGDATQTLRARWVIDAGGRENLYPSALKGVLRRAPFPKRAAVYSHFVGVRRAPGPRGGNIIIVRLEDGWFWVIPIGPDLTSVGLVSTAAVFREAGSPEALFQATVAASPPLRALLEGASSVVPFRVSADYSYVRRRFATGRVLLAGDAAAFFDPIFSSGVHLSTRSAALAVEAIIRAGADPLGAGERRRYTHALLKHASVFKRLIGVFYDSDGFSVFMSTEPPFGLERALTSIVAGHAELTWPLWWRFQFFLMVCRLQRHLPLVKRIGAGGRVALRTA